MVKEIKADEIDKLKPLMECLSEHHNKVSINFKGTYPRHLDKDRIIRFKEEVESNKSKVFVYEDNDKYVGVIKIDIDNVSGVIDYFVILNDYQGKGYGKALMDVAIKTFKENEVKNIELHVVYGNNAVNFYEKYGFKKQSYIMERGE